MARLAIHCPRGNMVETGRQPGNTRIVTGAALPDIVIPRAVILMARLAIQPRNGMIHVGR